jgi:hypothetical protein
MSTSNIGNASRPTFLRGNEQAHVVQFYTQDEFLLDGLCEFVRSALSEGESAVVVVVSKAHRDGLMERLQGCGADVSGAMKNGRCVVVDAAEALSKFMDGGMPDEKKFESLIGPLIRQGQSAAGGKRVAVFGEMVALLWAEKNFRAAMRLEQLWNELGRTHSFYLRCAYPASGFQDEQKGEPYASICGEHSAVMLAEACA